MAAVLSVGLLLVTVACEGRLRSPTSPTASAGSCGLTLDPAAQAALPGGGSFHTSVTGPCPWDAVTEESWISITYGKGAGVGSVTYSVQENPGAHPRVGRILVGGEILLVTQAGPDCRLAVQPAAHSMAAAGGSAEFSVATDVRCGWSATASDSWIELGVTGGSGPRTVSFSVGENGGAAERVARITVGDQEVLVRQTGRAVAEPPHTPQPPAPPAPPSGSSPPTAPPSEPCPASISPSSQNVSAAGGDFVVSVKAAAQCRWDASADVSWIKVQGGSGAGSGRFVHTVGFNDGPPRKGHIKVGDQVLSVVQERR